MLARLGRVPDAPSCGSGGAAESSGERFIISPSFEGDQQVCDETRLGARVKFP